MPANPPVEHRLQNRRLQVQNWKQRLRALALQPANKVCSECPELEPTWASLLQVQDDTTLGVFCCFRCYSYHFELSKEGVCSVKSINVAEEWSDEEIQALELGGNQVVNAIYEAGLDNTQPDTYDKSTLLDKEDNENTKARRTFVRDKYLHRKYFNQATFEEQMEIKRKYVNMGPKATALLQSFSHKPSAARRSRSYGEECDMPTDGCNNDNIINRRKALRRRSRSYGAYAEDDSSSDDDEEEDEIGVSYHMPGHLAEGRGGGAARRSSMPLLGGGIGVRTENKEVAKMAAKEQRERRDSLRAKQLQQRRRVSMTNLAKEQPVLKTPPSPAAIDLGYGSESDHESDHDTNNNLGGSHGTILSTDSAGLRRRKDVALPQRTARRCSMPALSAGSPDTTSAAAPRKPQRVYSDDEEDEVDRHKKSSPLASASRHSDGICSYGHEEMSAPNNIADYGYEMTAPSTIADRASRRMRRLSMPVSTIAQSAYEDLNPPTFSTITASANLSYEALPAADELTRVRVVSDGCTATLGLDLGYGSDKDTFQDSEDEDDVRPMRMLRRCSTGGDCFGSGLSTISSLTKPFPAWQRPLPEKKNVSGSRQHAAPRRSSSVPSNTDLRVQDHPKQFPSHADLGYGDEAPIAPIRKSKKKKPEGMKERNNPKQASVRRCSTGGKADMKQRKFPNETNSPCGPSADDLGYENDETSRPIAAKSKKKRAMRRSSTGGRQANKAELPAYPTKVKSKKGGLSGKEDFIPSPSKSRSPSHTGSDRHGRNSTICDDDSYSSSSSLSPIHSSSTPKNRQCNDSRSPKDSISRGKRGSKYPSRSRLSASTGDLGWYGSVSSSSSRKKTNTFAPMPEELGYGETTFKWQKYRQSNYSQSPEVLGYSDVGCGPSQEDLGYGKSGRDVGNAQYGQCGSSNFKQIPTKAALGYGDDCEDATDDYSSDGLLYSSDLNEEKVPVQKLGGTSPVAVADLGYE